MNRETDSPVNLPANTARPYDQCMSVCGGQIIVRFQNESSSAPTVPYSFRFTGAKQVTAHPMGRTPTKG